MQSPISIALTEIKRKIKREVDCLHDVFGAGLTSRELDK
jgi:hypothetical protein